ncbi:MAG: DUF1566 domain-containing protein [Arenicella sp.]
MTKKAWFFLGIIVFIIMILFLLRFNSKGGNEPVEKEEKTEYVSQVLKANSFDVMESPSNSSEKNNLPSNPSPERFQKMNEAGQLLPNTAAKWQCVLDNEEQLIWEVKTSDGGIQDKDFTFTWYQADEAEDEVVPENQIDGGECFYIDCHTAALIQSINDLGLCQLENWRLPTHKELAALDHPTHYYPDIDIRYFPNTVSSEYWSSSIVSNSKTLAWNVDFKNGFPYVAEKRLAYRVRLVHDVLRQNKIPQNNKP